MNKTILIALILILITGSIYSYPYEIQQKIEAQKEYCRQIMEYKKLNYPKSFVSLGIQHNSNSYRCEVIQVHHNGITVNLGKNYNYNTAFIQGSKYDLHSCLPRGVGIKLRVNKKGSENIYKFYEEKFFKKNKTTD